MFWVSIVVPCTSKFLTMAKSSKPKERTIYRDDDKGEFITKKEYERRDPATVTKEKVPVPPPKKNGKG
jgi:hypothetical protein